MGQFDEATAERRPGEGRPPTAIAGNAGVQNGYLGMRARYILETGQWEKIPLELRRRRTPATRTPACPAWPACRGCAIRRQQHLDLHCGRERGEAGRPRRRRTPPKPGCVRSREKARSRRPTRTRRRTMAIMEKEVAALVATGAAGQKDEARAPGQGGGGHRADADRAVRSAGSDQAGARSSTAKCCSTPIAPPMRPRRSSSRCCACRSARRRCSAWRGRPSRPATSRLLAKATSS